MTLSTSLVALPLYVYELTGSASATSAAFLVEVLVFAPYVWLALAGGVALRSNKFGVPPANSSRNWSSLRSS